MPEYNKSKCRDFENEIWLFIDMDLPEDQLNIWKDHLTICDKCSRILDETKKLISLASSNTIDIEEVRFDQMTKKIVSKKSFSFGKILSNLSFRPQKRSSIVWKVGLTFALVIAAIIISVTSKQQNTVKGVGKNILDWNGTEINNELIQLNQRITFMKSDSWNREINSIDYQIENLEKQAYSYSFE